MCKNGDFSGAPMTEQLTEDGLRRCRRDGLDLAYSVVGEGPPVLFVHGATATGRFEWAALANNLASRYRCILPDLRGHGWSTFPGSGMTGDEICADLRRLIDELELERPHLIGFSYGSEIALMLELSVPGTARSLVQLSPGTGRPSDYRAPRLDHLYESWPFALRNLHEMQHGSDHWRRLVTALHEDSLGRQEFSLEALAAIDCPILLLAGARDEATRRKQGKRFAGANSQARYVEIDGAAHAVHHECPQRVGQLIGDFLADVDNDATRTECHGAAESS
jgi:3-oxoadipate enol-lactonase